MPQIGAVDIRLVPLSGCGWGGCGEGWQDGLGVWGVVGADGAGGPVKGCPVTTSMRTKTVMVTVLGWTAARAEGW